MEDDGEALPLDRAFVLREGRDVTLVTWGAMIHETLAPPTSSRARASAAEVIDVATLKPLDHDTILASVAKTGALRDRARGGAHRRLRRRDRGPVAERASPRCWRPIERVTGYDTVMPLPRLEQHYMPSAERIVAAARRVCRFA